MHPNEIYSDTAMVTRLLADQAPEFAGLSVTAVESAGTDNALYRIGSSFVARLPRRASAISLLEKEIAFLPRLVDLPLAVPQVVITGQASDTFPSPFAVMSWIDGRSANPDTLTDPESEAIRMGQFLRALRALDIVGLPPAGAANHRRGVDLACMTATVHRCIDVLADEIDAAAARTLWSDALSGPRHSGSPVWLHGDLKGDNLLARNGRLVAVIDWGLCAAGDPAADFAAAWVWAAPGCEAALLDAAGADPAARGRARGWALYGAVIALSYYRGGKNEALCQTCRTTLARLGVQ